MEEIIRLAKASGTLRPGFDVEDISLQLLAHDGVLTGTEPNT
ncbi:hypothetical protein [Arthrobacter sp. ERGS1:01]|nr:hypothetical protein [Arthrobacter sp. ERGS1:01]